MDRKLLVLYAYDRIYIGPWWRRLADRAAMAWTRLVMRIPAVRRRVIAQELKDADDLERSNWR